MILRYVPHEKVESFKKDGWVFKSNILGHHGDHAIIMQKKSPRREDNLGFSGDSKLRVTYMIIYNSLIAIL